jgi:hypothetical protein
MLFEEENQIQLETVKIPPIFRLISLLRTATRSYKNWMYDSARHKQLINRKSIVFCGLVTPSKAVLKNLFRGTKLASLVSVTEKLCDLEWQHSYDEVKLVIAEVLKKVLLIKSQNPVDLSCQYSVLNICQRLLVLSFLHSRDCDLFVSEAGKHKNIDPYDAYAYQQNLYLDFGSSRGAANWYPRTIDMVNTNKKFFSLRFLHESESMEDFLETTSAEAFINLCESGALRVFKIFKTGDIQSKNVNT